MRPIITFCPNCEEATSQKEVYETLADGTTVVYATTCTVCGKDV